MFEFIKLKEKGGRVQTFSYGHAVNILSLNNTVWSLPNDSEFEFSKNVIRKKPSPIDIGGTTKKKTTRKRGPSSKSTKTS